MATVEKPLITAEEFMDMDLGAGAFELVRGAVVEVPTIMPASIHGRTVLKIGFALEHFGHETGHGYVLLKSAVATGRGPDTVRGPEVSYYSEALAALRGCPGDPARRARPGRRSPLTGQPARRNP